MRTPFIAGNWKMNLDGASARALAEGLRKELADLEGVRLAVAPPFLYIPAVVEALRGSNIAVAAQEPEVVAHRLEHRLLEHFPG